MSEEKPFDATPSRLQRAKREGDRPRSQDLGTLCAFAAAALAALGGAPLAVPAMQLSLAGAAASASALRAGDAIALDQPWGAYGELALYALAVPVAGFLAAVLANAAQTGGFTFSVPPPSLAKLNPFTGLKRLVGGEAPIAGAKAFVVALAVGAAAAPVVRDALTSGPQFSSPEALAALVRESCAAIAAAAFAVAAPFGFVDAILERAKWRRRLRMSHAEVKRDHKESEGDPQLRGRRRAAHRALVRGALERVREAAFVVANPAHVAIALEYRPPDVPVPRVLVRAIDAGAQTVKALAREHGVPIVEDVELARRLLATTGTGDFIPPDTYGAIAQIVASLVRAGLLRSGAA